MPLEACQLRLESQVNRSETEPPPAAYIREPSFLVEGKRANYSKAEREESLLAPGRSGTGPPGRSRKGQSRDPYGQGGPKWATVAKVPLRELVGSGVEFSCGAC